MSTIIEPNATVPPAFEPAERGVNGRTYTPDDLLQMPDEGRFELVDGKLVERNMGAESSLVTTLLLTKVTVFVTANNRGLTFTTDCGYQIYPQRPNLVRYPDGSFVRAGRFPNNTVPKGHIRIVPDLVWEVVSPRDLAEDVQAKIEEYQSVHVPLIWVLYPNLRSIYVYRDGKPVERLGSDDTLTGGDLLPGFACRLADIFPFPAVEPEQQPQS
jgi:Uma2 family endonuclease